MYKVLILNNSSNDDIWEKIEKSTYDDFLDYLKIKEAKNYTDDCILNTETQPIPSSYDDEGKEIYGGSSYKRTPKKQRKRN